MDALIIEPTKATPRVNFQPEGELKIEGRSLPEDPFTFYNPVLNWIRNYSGNEIVLDLRLEYMNTASSKQIFTLLADLKDNTSIKNHLINWHYEEGDEDALDTGKEFEQLVNIPFQFHEYAEA
jgi:hypothetical protein